MPPQLEGSAPVFNRGSASVRLFLGPGVTWGPLRIGPRVVAVDDAGGELRVVGVSAP